MHQSSAPSKFPLMSKFATVLALILVSDATTSQAFCWQAQPTTFRVQSPLLPRGKIQITQPPISPMLTTHRRDVSLAFLNRDATKKTKSIEEEVIPKPPVIVDTFPPDVEHSHPSVDQDAKWMEQEAITEVLSILAVFALLALLEIVFQKVHS